MSNQHLSGHVTINLAVESAALSDQGRKKRNNEDWVERHEPDDAAELTLAGRLYIVADGVGGAAQGEKASKYAAQKVLYDYYQLTDLEPSERLRVAIQSANADIYSHTEQADSPETMGTTLVAAALRGPRLAVANVGDSRAYLIRGGQIRQLTRDHSLVQQLLDDQEITPEQAATFRRKNVILRSVGSDQAVEVDVFQYEVKAGDLLLMCTDGLHKYFRDPDEMALMATSGSLEQAARRLINLANERGGSDNISVVLVRVLDPQSVSARTSGVVAPRPVSELDLDELPTSPGLKQAGGGSRRLFIGGRPVSGRWQVALLAAGVLLIVLLVALGLAVGTQIFGQDPTPQLTNTLVSTQALIATPVSDTPIPSTELASTPSAATPVPTSEMAPAQAATLAVTALPTSSTQPTAAVTAITLETAPICQWTVPAGGSLAVVYRTTWPTTDWGEYQRFVSQLNGGIDVNKLQADQAIRVPWPTIVDAGEPPCLPE